MNTLSSYVTSSQLDSAIASALASALVYKGSATVATLNALGTTATNGDVYVMSDSGTLTQGNLSVSEGDTVAWNGSAQKWEKLSQVVDLSSYVTNAALANTLASYVTNNALNNALASYVTSSDLTNVLNDYVTSSNLATILASYVTSGALSDALATTMNFKGSATVNTINALTDVSHGDAYVLSDDGTLTAGNLAVVAGETVVYNGTDSVWVKISQIADLSDYVTSSSLTTTLADYVQTSALADYVTTTALADTLNDYLLASAIGDFSLEGHFSSITIGDSTNNSKLSYDGGLRIYPTTSNANLKVTSTYYSSIYGSLPMISSYGTASGSSGLLLFDTSLIPNTNNYFDLGNTGRYWKRVYATTVYATTVSATTVNATTVSATTTTTTTFNLNAEWETMWIANESGGTYITVGAIEPNCTYEFVGHDTDNYANRVSFGRVYIDLPLPSSGQYNLTISGHVYTGDNAYSSRMIVISRTSGDRIKIAAYAQSGFTTGTTQIAYQINFRKVGW